MHAFNSILRFPSRCILAQPNMHFIVPCRGDRRAAVTHSSKSFCLSSLCKYRAGISARPSTKEWIKVIECYQETKELFSKKKKRAFFFRQQISLIKFLFDLTLLEHHNIRSFGVNALNGESIIRYPLTYERTEWKKSNETRDGY